MKDKGFPLQSQVEDIAKELGLRLIEDDYDTVLGGVFEWDKAEGFALPPCYEWVKQVIRIKENPAIKDSGTTCHGFERYPLENGMIFQLYWIPNERKVSWFYGNESMAY